MFHFACLHMASLETELKLQTVNNDESTIYNPMGSMYDIYSLQLPLKSNIHVGKYTSPVDGMATELNMKHETPTWTIL